MTRPYQRPFGSTYCTGLMKLNIYDCESVCTYCTGLMKLNIYDCESVCTYCTGLMKLNIYDCESVCCTLIRGELFQTRSGLFTATTVQVPVNCDKDTDIYQDQTTI